MSDERQRPSTGLELLYTKDRIVELWRLLPAEHQATLLLVLLKDIADPNMASWTRDAVLALSPPQEGSVYPLPTLEITRDRLVELEIDEQWLALLTDDLPAIARSIQQSFQKDEFWDELIAHIVEAHTERVLQARGVL